MTTALHHRLSSTSGSLVDLTVSRRAASLRALSVNGIDLVEPTILTEPPPGLAGATLAPWPNRVEGARWMLNGTEQLLEMTEPELGHANHGLLTDTEFGIVSASEERIVFRALVEDRPGYPFTLEVEVHYTLEASGVRVRHSVRNLSSEVAPFAMGAHPYLRVGDQPVETLTVEIDAGDALSLDDTHIPRGRFRVEGSAWDVRGGRSVSTIVPHAAYTGLALADGRVVHSLLARDGNRVELWADADYAWVQVYVVDTFESDRGPRTAIAVEPMTAPPNALRTGEGLRWLEPSASWTAEWGIRLA